MDGAVCTCVLLVGHAGRCVSARERRLLKLLDRARPVVSYAVMVGRMDSAEPVLRAIDLETGRGKT